MRKKASARLRREVTATVAVTTVLLLLALSGAGYLVKTAPARRLEKIESAISAGAYDRARALAEGLEDDRRREVLSRCDYALAAEQMAAGDYERAGSAFAALGNYADAAERLSECVYLRAKAALAQGDYDGAAALFTSLGGWGDSALQAQEAVYAAAAAEENAGEYRSAAERFLSLGAYRDARDRAVAAAIALTGEKDGERALLRLRALTPEAAEAAERLRNARAALRRGIIDVGFYHTVGLCADGTVLACGENTDGQCDVKNWKNITAVAAGGYHTVGLRSDGTVAAAGRNTEGQCEVSSWTDITAVACGDYATFGLRADGTVVAAGFLDYYMLPGWTGVSFITGGSHNVGALRGNGEAVLSHASGRSEALTDLVDLAINTGFAVGVRQDGSVVSPSVPLDWREILTVSASGTAILGITSDGHVIGHFFRAGDALPLESLTNIAALAAGGTHSAFVKADGTVTVLGHTDRGQGDTTAWQLF